MPSRGWSTGVEFMSDRAREGQRRLATIAAVFWFEMVGALFVGSMVLSFLPLPCDPGPEYEAPGPCARGVSALGLVASVPVVAVAVGGGVLAVLPFLWVGIPAFLLLASWLPVLAQGVRGSSFHTRQRSWQRPATSVTEVLTGRQPVGRD